MRGGYRTGAGRPAGSPNRATAEHKARLSDLARVHADDALATLAEIARNGTTDASRVSAACAILDRAFGRPRQSVELELDVHDDAPMVIQWQTVEPLHLAWPNASTSTLHELHQLLTAAGHPQAASVAAEIAKREPQ